MPQSLPIWQVAPAVIHALRSGNRLVLSAPTGSGKSTQLPQMLVDELGLKKIVVLQPRRVAARTLAARVAWERHGRLGEEVGYQIRFEDRSSVGTRILFVTEGVLLRWLQDDPALSEFDAIIFDEFHERNLYSDVALALSKAIQRKRPELRLVVMSATLDTARIASYLEPSPVVVSEGISFPVEVSYLSFGENKPIADLAADAVQEIISTGEQGDILVFMPGMAEINATISTCRSRRFSEPLVFFPLHGDLTPEEQDRAFAPNAQRKVVVSTNVAETSVTIDGVRHVVDSGLARVARYDPERGINTLHLEEISRASADQRKGRAGRTAPGTCRRLWSESNHLNRPERNTPEIQRADLAEVVLLLHSLGIRRAADFDWLDRPEPAAVEQAENLLRILGALKNHASSESSGLSEIGRQMLRLPMHPRYSRMLIEAAQRNCLEEAALCAALVSGRDMLVRLSREDKHIQQAREEFENSDQSDFFPLMAAFDYAAEHQFEVDACRRRGIHALTARQVALTFREIMQTALQNLNPPKSSTRSKSPEALQCSLLAGFVDQLCLRKDQGTLDCYMTGGRSGTLARESVVQKSPLFVAGSVREISGKHGRLTLITLATAVTAEWLKAIFPQHFSCSIEYLYDRQHKRVAGISTRRFLDLPIEKEHLKELDPQQTGQTLADAYLRGEFELPLLTHELKQFMARVNFVAKAVPELEFPWYHREALRAALARAFSGVTLAKEAQARALKSSILAHLQPEQIGWLDELAPLSIPWLDGKKLKLLYPENEPSSSELHVPEAQVKLHECFGLVEHPRVCEGKIALRLWLCSPDGKRLQSTTHWPDFKKQEYPKIRSTLQKKHPGFNWL